MTSDWNEKQKNANSEFSFFRWVSMRKLRTRSHFIRKIRFFFKCKLVTYFGKCETINCIVRGEFTFFSSASVSPFPKIFNSQAQWINFAVWIQLNSYYTNPIQLNTVTYMYYRILASHFINNSQLNAQKINANYENSQALSYLL